MHALIRIQGQHPAIISPFQFADPSYYPEPLAETVKQDVRRIAKTQSSRSATEHSGQVRCGHQGCVQLPRL